MGGHEAGPAVFKAPRMDRHRRRGSQTGNGAYSPWRTAQRPGQTDTFLSQRICTRRSAPDHRQPPGFGQRLHPHPVALGVLGARERASRLLDGPPVASAGTKLASAVGVARWGGHGANRRGHCWPCCCGGHCCRRRRCRWRHRRGGRSCRRGPRGRATSAPAARHQQDTTK
jgi:hypothetical protein